MRSDRVRGRLRRLTTAIPAMVSIAGFFVAWEAAARLLVKKPIFFPYLSDILAGLFGMALAGSIFPHIAASLFRSLSGFSSAALAAIPLAILAGYFARLRRFVDPLIELFRPIPPISLIPLLILWFGIGDLSKVVLIFFACFFPIFLNTAHGVSRADRMLIRAGKILGASEPQILWKVIIPAALPEIFTGLRISLALSLLAIVAAELVAADRGLGFLILDSQRTYDTVSVFVGIITIAFLGFGMDGLVRIIRRHLMPWLEEE